MRTSGSTPDSRSVRQLERPIALGQAAAVGGHGERDMAERRLGPSEAPIDQDLTGCARRKVGASDDLIDSHGGIVDHHGKLVRRSDRLAGDEEIAADPARVELHRAQEEVIPDDRLPGHAESPCERAISELIGIAGTPVRARPGVARPLLFRMGCTGGSLDVGPRAGAGIHPFRRLQTIERGAVQRQALRLDIGSGGAADVGPFVPVESQPAQILEDGPAGLVANPGHVEVLDFEGRPAHHPDAQPARRSGRSGHVPGAGRPSATAPIAPPRAGSVLRASQLASSRSDSHGGMCARGSTGPQPDNRVE